jgi:hypothetical protein
MVAEEGGGGEIVGNKVELPARLVVAGVCEGVGVRERERFGEGRVGKFKGEGGGG